MRRPARLLPSALVLYWALLFGALLAFAGLAEEVYRREGFGFDAPLLAWLHGLQSPALTGLALGLSWSGRYGVLAAACAGLALWLWRRSRREVIYLALGVGGAGLLNLEAKGLFARLRPDLFPQLSPEASFSFPSGHAMGSLAFALTLWAILRRVAPRRGWAALPLLAWAALVALSRPYLQVHYPSDILAGWALTAAWVTGLELGWRRLHPAAPPSGFDPKGAG